MFQYSIHAAKILKRFNLYDENANSMKMYTAKDLAESNEVCPPTILALPNNKIVNVAMAKPNYLMMYLFISLMWYNL